MVTALHVWQTLQVEMMNYRAKRLLDEGKSKINCLFNINPLRDRITILQ